MNLEDLHKLNSSINPKYLMYQRTNEDLDALFKKVDFEDKKVFSVLASTDQVLASYYYGAKQVDTFDRNIMTLYYYYLRKWCFKYLGQYYPILNNKAQLMNLIHSICPNNNFEADAKRFWIYVLRSDYEHRQLFEYSPCAINGKYINDDNLEKTFNNKISFQHIDMFKKINLNKKYDVIIMSNMIEYLKGDKDSLTTVRNNILKIANDDCLVICSLILHKNSYEYVDIEKEIFKQGNLIFNKKYKAYDTFIGGPRTLGYSYKLKKN